MKYRKKPVVIDAIKFDGTQDSIVKIMGMSNQRSMRFENNSIFIDTLEGKMQANVGDWVIKGVKGECYPCKPDIFEATYEKVE